MSIAEALRRALKNIAVHGDTDIFPRPFETYAFFDRPEDCLAKLLEMHENFHSLFASHPPSSIVTLAQVGYTGFRWGTQIEPFWNAYYLALVIALADRIEDERIAVEERVVFSYRYGWNEQEAKLFKDISWRDYRARALELSRRFDFVVLTDIADFYPRVSHHRLENALRRLPEPDEFPARIMKFLALFSGGVSHGLPVGGPASRILAELALIPVDQHLFRRNVVFCRYADDFSIFCRTKSEAYNSLVLLSDKLHNENLTLQKSKTRILTAAEFQEMTAFLGPEVDGLPRQEETDEQKLLRISIRFDPYSDDPEEDYEKLKSAVQEVDILGILGREIAKTSIDPALARQAISAIRALSPFAQDGAIRMLLDDKNVDILSPVFVPVMRAVRGVYNELAGGTKDFVDKALLELYERRAHVLSVELNLCYFIQAVAMRRSRRKEEVLIELFDTYSSHLIRRQIILTMANWKAFFWLPDVKKRFSALSEWEKRAFMVASYVLGDEGQHWRRYAKHSWGAVDKLLNDWSAARWERLGTIPL